MFHLDAILDALEQSKSDMNAKVVDILSDGVAADGGLISAAVCNCSMLPHWQPCMHSRSLAFGCAGLLSVMHMSDSRSLELTRLNTQKFGCKKGRREILPGYIASAESALPSLHTVDSPSFIEAARRHIVVGDYASSFRSGKTRDAQRFHLRQRKASALEHAANEVFRKPVYGTVCFAYAQLSCARRHSVPPCLHCIAGPDAGADTKSQVYQCVLLGHCYGSATAMGGNTPCNKEVLEALVR